MPTKTGSVFNGTLMGDFGGCGSTGALFIQGRSVLLNRDSEPPRFFVAIIRSSEKCSILRTGLCPKNVAYFGHDRPDETHDRLEATHSCAYPVGSRFGLDSHRLR